MSSTCKTDGCDKVAEYGYIYKERIACKEHRILIGAKMVNVVTKRCIVCIKRRANYGEENGKSTHCGTCVKKLKLNLQNLVNKK
jgi:hypothetical protein